MVSTKSLSPEIGILTGPTASGKTSLALQLIDQDPTIEIVNADSLLIYRKMDIGTAKPTKAEQKKVRHHLIDIKDPSEAYTAGDFKRDAEAVIAEIYGRGHRPLFVGGTGFYLKSLIHGLWDAPKSDPALKKILEALTNDELLLELEKRDPAAALRIGIQDRYRLIRACELIRLTGKSPTELENAQASALPDPRFKLWIIDRPSPELFSRISLRSQKMLGEGFVSEVKMLLDHFPNARPLEAVGYREAVSFLKGEKPRGRKLQEGLEGLADEITLATRQLVKRQRTWFRGQAKSAEWFLLDRDLGSLQRAWEKVYKL